MCPQIFYAMYSIFVGSRPKIINRFQRTRFQLKAYHFNFLYWGKKLNFLFFKILKFSQKNVLFWQSFFLNYVFCQHKRLISTDEVSNKILWYLLSILVKKIWKKLKKLNDHEKWKKKLGRGETYSHFFYEFKD